ncbi:hypothetical protein KI387_029595 [Taxus chinensis]|uniref:5-formyltetrahydrofolate cyclo-ligase n=1 Tax=Taxus chinensis TaxID=29808 RepID=A0AA38CFI9_TAXCH|nr:hypothetical protein KI387_029595 [Taxus chinensis]
MATRTTTAASGAVLEQKQALRSRVRRNLKALDPIQRKQQDEAVQKLVLEAPWFKSSTSLCAYISCEGLREVDTSKIISSILHKPDSACNMQIPKTLYVPRVEDKESNMKLLHITSVSELIGNSMNILEPTPLDNTGHQREDVMQADKPVDLLLLPGLAFDRSGRRLGRGGGYYDRFIKTYLELAGKRGWQPPLSVALAYSTQILDEAIPVSALDVPVDAIVSPSGVISVSSIALERM